jgi:hypothetical protein
MASQNYITLGAVARHFGLADYQVRRLYERKILPDPPRAGLYRLIDPADLPVIEAALRKAGVLPKSPAAALSTALANAGFPPAGDR